MFTIPKSSRRTLIKSSLAAAGSLALRPFGLMPALAQSASDYKALVCVFLLGGNDSNNTIVPMDDSRYQAYTALRGNLALTGNALTPTVQDVNGAPFAFHSQLAGLSSLFASRELSVVANVGPLVQPLTRAEYIAKQVPQPSNLFSHSDQISLWQSSIAQGQSPTGWGGRLADQVLALKMNTGTFPAFISTGGSSLMGTGAQTTALAVTPGQALTLGGFNNTAPSQARYNAVVNLLNLDSGISLIQAAKHTLTNSINDATKLSESLAKAPALKTVFPNTNIGNQLKQVAQVMQVHADLNMSRQIFFATIGGFDTHAAQIATQNNLYAQLGPALAAFYQATLELSLGANVTTFTESDFSRTFNSTSGDGSDHAWGSNQIVMGGAVKGGRIFGQFPQFVLAGPDDADTRGRWIPTTSVDQMGATLATWFGVPNSSLATVFPNLKNFPMADLGFVG